MGFGDAVAKTYLFPEQQPAAGPQRRAAASGSPEDFKWEDYSLEMPKDELQTTGALAQRTAKYYKDLADLRQFAKTMKVQYGIDVLAPDPHNPNAIWASETFKQRIGLLTAEHNAARRGATVENQYNTPIAQGQFMPSQQMYSGADYAGNIANRGFATAAPWGLKQVAEDSGVKNLTPAGAAERTQNFQIQAQDLEEAAQHYPAGSPERDKMLFDATQMRKLSTVPAENAPNSFMTMFGQKLKTGETELRRIINHKIGNFTDAKVGDYFHNGTFWRENKDYNGTDIGKIPVKDPKTGKEYERTATIDKTVQGPNGEVMWVFKEKDVPPMRIDNLPVKTILTYLKGVNKTAIDEFLAQYPQLLDASSNVVESNFYNPDEGGKIASARDEANKHIKLRNAVAEKELAEFDKMSNNAFTAAVTGPFGGAGRFATRFSPTYGNVTIKRDGDKWTIDNIKELIPGKDRAFYDEFKSLDKSGLVRALSQLGIQSFNVQSEAQPNPTGVVNEGKLPATGARQQFAQGWATFNGKEWVLDNK